VTTAFLDTGIFVAFLDRSDRYHTDAAALFADPPRRWCTSLAVVSETYGWFLRRLGEDAARTFRLLLTELPRLELLALDSVVTKPSDESWNGCEGTNSPTLTRPVSCFSNGIASARSGARTAIWRSRALVSCRLGNLRVCG